MAKRFLALWAFILLSASPAGAQDSTATPADPWNSALGPDRPGAASPTTTVGLKVAQLETCLQRGNDGLPKGARTTLTDFPTLLRLGITPTVELRAQMDGYIETTQSPYGDIRNSGRGDLNLGIKWNPARGDGAWLPAVALNPNLSIATGAPHFTAHYEQYHLAALFDWSLPSQFRASLNLGESRVTWGFPSRYSWMWNAAAALAFAPSRRWALNGDLFVAQAGAPNQDNGWGADQGVAFLLDPDTQFDLSMIETLNGEQRPRSIQLGLTRRVGPHS